MVKIIFPVLLLMFLVACGTADNSSEGGTSSTADYTVKNTEAESSEGDFTYRLVSEQKEYASGGPVEIYAELEYTGEKESIDIFHAGSAFFFPMEEKTRNYEIGYPMEEPLLTTTLTKGEPLREYYTGSGGYSNQDDAEYIEFMEQLTNNEFPEGYYIVNGYADFYTETAGDNKTDYELHGQIDFKVVSEE